MAKHDQHNAQKRAVNRAILREAKASGCVRCGEAEVRTLGFHHVDPGSKEFTIGRSVMVAGPDRLRAEIAKCVVLCANCHLIVEDELRQQGPASAPDPQMSLI